MTTLPLMLALTLGGCSWFGGDTPEPTAQDAKKKAGQADGKARKARKAAKEGEDAKEKKTPAERPPPVLRTGRFAIPLNALPNADLSVVQAAAVTAWEKVVKEEAEAAAPATEGFPKPWKCRRATFFGVSGEAEPLPALRLYERYPKPACGTDDDSIERWELSLRYELPERPPSRDGGGEFRYLMSSRDLTRTGDAWVDTYANIFRRDSGKLEMAFPHDTEWLGEQLPKGITIDSTSARVNSERWALGKYTVASEPMSLEVERWSCAEGGAFVGAELVFRTNKREPGHTSSSPKDVMVTEQLQTFADAVVAELGARVGGTGMVAPAAGTCSK